MNADELQAIWGIPGPWSARAITLGVNNRTREIETPMGKFILRQYPDDRALAHIRFELAVLTGLQERRLSFQVPAPIPTVRGDAFAVLSGAVVTLTPVLTGSPPESDAGQAAASGQAGASGNAAACGKALGELVRALANLRLEQSEQAHPFPRFGDFRGWAGMEVDPAQRIHEISPDAQEKDQALALLDEVQEAAPALYQTLPQQMIHRDYDSSNVLMQGKRVTGVLDFEFCGYDLRIMDLAYALSKWPDGSWGTGAEWRVMEAFAQGFLKRQKLTQGELEALPLAFRIRAAAGLFYRFGRYARGLETAEHMQERIHNNLSIVVWLKDHEEELLDRARRWGTMEFQATLDREEG